MDLRWHHIKTVSKGPFDLWARQYNNFERRWEYSRFINCSCAEEQVEGRLIFSGIPPDWEPTHWMPVPDPPKET